MIDEATRKRLLSLKLRTALGCGVARGLVGLLSIPESELTPTYRATIAAFLAIIAADQRGASAEDAARAGFEAVSAHIT